jgi:hypothetical protein
MTQLRSATPAHRETSCPAGIRNPVITQQRLARYRELSALDRERRSLRRELLGLLAAGAPVEPGRLRIRVCRNEARRLNFKTLRAVFTDPELNWLRSVIEPTITQSLQVTADRPSPRSEHEEPTEATGAPHRVPRGGPEAVRPPEAC